MATPTPVDGRDTRNGYVISKTQLWAGRIMSGLAALFLLWDGVMKLLKPAFVVKASQSWAQSC
jgi:hypothetical protein